MSGGVEDDGSLTIIRGDDVYIPLEYVEDDETTPIDLTGCTFKAQVRNKPGGYIALEFDFIEQDLENGKLTLHLPHEETELVRLTEAVWDFQINWPSGDVFTEIEPAPVTIIRDVSI